MDARSDFEKVTVSASLKFVKLCPDSKQEAVGFYL